MVLPHNGGGFNHQYTILTIKQQQLTYINLERRFGFCEISVLKKNMSLLLLPPYPLHPVLRTSCIFQTRFYFLACKTLPGGL